MKNLNLEIVHVEVHVSSVEKAKEFYIHKLGLEFLEETPAANLFSVKAGNVRISIFGGYETNEAIKANQVSTHIIFKTNNIETTVAELSSRGIVFTSKIIEAPNFIKCITTQDPDGNVIEIGEYLRDPLKKVVDK
jgi:predicted enzyme related to lactoylglutathione lyase